MLEVYCRTALLCQHRNGDILGFKKIKKQKEDQRNNKNTKTARHYALPLHLAKLSSRYASNKPYLARPRGETITGMTPESLRWWLNINSAERIALVTLGRSTSPW